MRGGIPQSVSAVPTRNDTAVVHVVCCNAPEYVEIRELFQSVVIYVSRAGVSWLVGCGWTKSTP